MVPFRVATCAFAFACLAGGTDMHLATYSSYLGGSGDDVMAAMAVDTSGNVYVVGQTASTDFPLHSLRTPGGGTDAFLVKINPTSGVVWATSFGGANADQAKAVAVDSSGAVTIAGLTHSSDLPLKDARQSTLAGNSDAFVARFRSDGELIFSTYLGGSGADEANGLVVTATGEIWVVGQTESPGFPVLNAYQTFRGGSDGFLARFGATGSLQSSTFFGGSGLDAVRAIALDTSGEIYVTGTTTSMDFPVLNAFQPTLAGAPDAFVAKLSADGRTLRYSTYLGGPANQVAGVVETGAAIAVDAAGAATVVGSAPSGFPLVNSLQSYGDGTTDAFVARVSPAGSALLFSTYLGGTSTDEGNAVSLLPDGSVYVGGTSVQVSTSHDGFFSKLNPQLTRILATTRLAGLASDTVLGVVARGTQVYVAGSTTSTSLLPGGAHNGSIDGYVVRYEEQPIVFQFSPPESWIPYTITGTGCQPGLYYGTSVFPWTLGSSCSISIAPSLINGTRRLRFTTWSDGWPANPRPFDAVPGQVVFGMNFATDHQVTRTVSPAGAGVVAFSPDPGDGWVAAGSVLGLVATPNPGYAFVNWSGSASETSTSVSKTIFGPATFTANFSCAYSLNASTAAFEDTGGTGSVNLTAGAGCQWTAASSAAWLVITNGNSGSGSTTVQFQVASNANATPRSATLTIGGRTFSVSQGGAASISVTIATVPAGLEWSVAGQNCGAGSYTGQTTLTWLRRTQCTVTATAMQTSGSTRRVFTSWNDGQTASTRVLTATTNISWTASFRTEHYVGVGVSPANGGTATPSDAWHAEGSDVQLTASPAAGYAFVNWNGSPTAVTATIVKTVTGPAVYTANFACAYGLGATAASFDDAGGAGSVDLTAGAGCGWTATSSASWIAVSNGGSGTGSKNIQFQVSGNPSGISRSGILTIGGKSFTVSQGGVPNVSVTIATNPAGLAWSVAGQNCAAGSYTGQATLTWMKAGQCTVTIAAVQTAGSTRRVFTSWNDGQTGTSRVLSATANAGWALSFRTEHYVQVGVTPSASGTVTPGDGWHTEGSVVQFSAAPAAGFSFTGWTGGWSGGGASVSRTITTPLSITAVFTAVAPSCLVQPNPASMAVAAAGISQTITFTTSPPGCTWNATSNAEWVQVYPLSGKGSGTTSIRVYPSFSTRIRTTAVRVGDQSIAITQAPAAGTYEERLAGLMYFNFFGRIGRADEIGFHAGTLKGGLPAAQMVTNFFGTAEFNMGGRFIAGLYVGLLNRDAEFGGWLFQRTALSTGLVDQTQLVENFLSTPEYILTFGNPSDDDFVRLLYRYVLLREASQAEVNFQAGTLKGTLTRTQLAGNFLNSAEFRNGTGPRLTAFLLYSCVLLRDGTSTERSTTAGQVAGGQAIRELVDAMLASPEFATLLQ